MLAKSSLFINIQFGFPTFAWTGNIFSFGCLSTNSSLPYHVLSSMLL